MGRVEQNYFRCEFKSYEEFEREVDEISGQSRSWLYRGQGLSVLPQPRFLRGPNSKRDADGLETQFIEYFHKNLGRSFPKNSFGKWRILTWLQHYGAPTRLLDWTEDALVALWFAVSTRMFQIESGVSNRSTVATVWLLEVAEDEWIQLSEKACLAPSEVSNSKFVRPPEIDARVVAQRSVFSAHRLPRSSLDCAHGLWPDWESKLKNRKMFALSCEDAAIPQLFASLKDAGITRASVYPDLMRVSDELNRHFQMAPDMYLVRSDIAMPFRSN